MALISAHDVTKTYDVGDEIAVQALPRVSVGVSAGELVVDIALALCVGPALCASRVDPIEALRTDRLATCR